MAATYNIRKKDGKRRRRALR